MSPLGEEITVVSGLPRSGTSLMMQMLRAGGMTLFTDNRRLPDSDNPRGYFEHESVKLGRGDLSWLPQAQGKAVKVIHLLLPQLPLDHNYNVIFMDRDLQEVIASQRVMLQRQGLKPAPLTDEALAQVFQKQIATVRQWLAEHPRFRVLTVHHRDVIALPKAAADQIALFLRRTLAVENMVSAVDPALYRQRPPPPALGSAKLS